MLVNNSNYQKCFEQEKEKNKILTEELNKLFDKSPLKSIPIGVIGNSIASGYSRCDEMIPFLSRTDLPKNEKVDIYSYTRIRKNEESNVYKWYMKNISHQDANRFLYNDIMEKMGRYANCGPEQLSMYETLAASQTLGMRDFIKLQDNIIIFGGLTGTFTDILRKGNAHDWKKIIDSFKIDAAYLKATLLGFYLDNPTSQIYVFGIPDVMGLGISSSIADKYIKEAVKTIPSAIYIKGSPRNMLSKLEGQIESDIHYSRPEYLQLLNKIFTSIIENFYILPFKGKLLAAVAEASHIVEKEDSTMYVETESLMKIVHEYIEIYREYIPNINSIIPEIIQYYNDYYILNYPCTNRKEVICELKKIIH